MGYQQERTTSYKATLLSCSQSLALPHPHHMLHIKYTITCEITVFFFSIQRLGFLISYWLMIRKGPSSWEPLPRVDEVKVLCKEYKCNSHSHQATRDGDTVQESPYTVLVSIHPCVSLSPSVLGRVFISILLIIC